MLEKTIRDHLKKQQVQALVRVITADDPFAGVLQLVEAYGLGTLVPNTIMIGDSEDMNKRDRYCHMIAQLYHANRSVMILRENPEMGFGKYRRIHVWWGGMQANGGLMLLLAYLLRSTIEWRDAEIYLQLVVPNENAAQDAQNNLNALIRQLRIAAIPKVIIAANRSFMTILQASSQDADIIFLGMAPPNHEDFTDYYERLHTRTANLPTIVYVMAAPNFAFAEVLTEGSK